MATSVGLCRPSSGQNICKNLNAGVYKSGQNICKNLNAGVYNVLFVNIMGSYDTDKKNWPGDGLHGPKLVAII